MLVDVVKRVTSGPLPDDEDSQGYLVGLGFWWMRARAAIGHIYHHTGEKLEVALGRTRMAAAIQDILGDSVDKDKIDLEVRDREENYPTFRAIDSTILNQTLYRCLITTRNKYLGLAPLTVQEGDMVFLLSGSDVPFVLRKLEENCFQLVGQCYVHGIMDGEFINPEHGDGDNGDRDQGVWQDLTLV